MCEKETKNNLMNRVQVTKKDSYERINVIFCNPHSPEINSGQVFSADSYKRVKNERKESKKINPMKKSRINLLRKIAG